MKAKFVLEQLNRFERCTNQEVVDLKADWEKGYTGSEYIIPHNEGHLLAIESAKGLIKDMGEYINKVSLKKVIKAKMKECKIHTMMVDNHYELKLALGKTEDEAGSIFDDNYFRFDGMDCAYRTILEILRKDYYFPKDNT